MPSAVGIWGASMAAWTHAQSSLSLITQKVSLHPDVVELECKAVLSPAAGSGEPFSLRP